MIESSSPRVDGAPVRKRPPVRAGRGPARPVVNRSALTRRTSLSIQGAISIETWKQIGEQIFRISDSSAWWLGDWLVYGQNRYPERYKRAIDETSLDYQTLRNYAWVARRFVASRRRDELSFQHHMEVASLSPDEQDQWLDRARAQRWSRNELRARLRAARMRPATAEGPAAVIQIDASKEQRARWERAADSAMCDLGEWIQHTLDQAAEHGLSA
ncbi:LmbU family transcriptional regulator [Actinomadura monticuli]|uniref:LmbU family transcriptional regulator n=1 Tax=Actinomadura monticuli TaxID=3097367 RepID=A0ABV4Q4T7_9ACTN